MLLLKGKEKLPPNCNKHCVSLGKEIEDKLTNHSSLMYDITEKNQVKKSREIVFLGLYYLRFQKFQTNSKELVKLLTLN